MGTESKQTITKKTKIFDRRRIIFGEARATDGKIFKKPFVAFVSFCLIQKN